MQRTFEETAGIARFWAARIAHCLAAQSPAIEFLLAVVAVLVAGNVPKSQGFSAYLARAAEALALIGFFASSVVGMSLSRSSSV